MSKMFESLTIGRRTIENRVVVPAMVCGGYSEAGGFATDKNTEHYRALAAGGAGLIIQEATSVSNYGLVQADQLGVWSDAHIDGLKRIAEAVHDEGGSIVVQLCHGGVVSIEETTYCPSDYHCVKGGKEKNGVALTMDRLKAIQEDFIQGAIRVKEAGYDGIELHGCHRYLISQFYNIRVNRREDAYGMDPGLFAREIIQGIRRRVGGDFIIGMRLGGFEPTLEDSIAYAKDLEIQGIDFLDISYGCSGEFDAFVPEGYAFKDIIYAADQISKHVSVPVFAVNGIETPELAEDILTNTSIACVDIGRGFLVNPNWVKDAKAGIDVGRCVHCKGCFWHTEPGRCPGRKLLLRARQ